MTSLRGLLPGTIDRSEYQDSVLSDGSTSSNRDRHFYHYGTTLRGSYELTPGVKPFVEASLDSITAAAASAASNMPADFRVSITDAAAADAYPIASFTWLLVPTRIKDAEKGRAMKDFLAWMLVDGQKLAPALQYAPLPEAVIGLERQALDRITVGAT